MHQNSPDAIGRHGAHVTAPCLQISGAWCYRLVRIALACVFIGSGLSKLFNPQSFVLIVEAYGLVPDAVIWPAALMLSIAELAAGMGLIFDVRWSLGTVTGLLLLFMAVLGYGWWLGLDVDCGCFGPGDPEGVAYHGLRPAFYRDVVLLAGVGYLYFWRNRQSLQPRRLPFIKLEA